MILFSPGKSRCKQHFTNNIFYHNPLVISQYLSQVNDESQEDTIKYFYRTHLSEQCNILIYFLFCDLPRQGTRDFYLSVFGLIVKLRLTLSVNCWEYLYQGAPTIRSDIKSPKYPPFK